MDKDERLGIIRRYFSLGLKYNDIVDVLLRRHNIEISRRQLIRVLHSNGLHRRKCDDILDAVDFIIKQQESSGALHGYRWMFEKCKTLGLRIYKEEVRCLLSVINPENVALRQRHRLRRRQYSAKGPNFIWHMDSYDKLKPFGICINGCIDGFSRKIVWLNAYFTSSDPALIGSYFIDSVQKLGGCPMIVRADMGTENTVVCELQRFLREDDDDSFQGDKSFLYGKSSCNQRIECWWGMLRKECADFWIDMFKKLRDDGDFDGTFADQNLILFCFLHIAQSELDTTAEVWNNHLIRPSKAGTTPHGRPNILYTLPEICQTRNYLCRKSAEEIDVCKETVEFRDTLPCDEDVYNWCINYMSDHSLSLADEPAEARDLYLRLKRSIRQIL